MVVPPWLEPLLGSAFFHICRIHGDAARSECNMFCLDCHSDAFCYYCRSSRHKDHQVIQIRRSSYHDVVRVGDVQKVLDISGVQTYVINSARVMFLNQRPQPKSGKGVAHLCEICGRSLLDPFRFCSLGCKLVGVKRNGNTSFDIEGSKSEEGISMTRSSRRDREALREGSQQGIYPPTPPSSSRRRKGIPHRAPFNS
ncbi:protein RGF1 INDUCIBLE TRANSCRIPTION FACTOR 1-like [Amaranthus tricolor]|uniref:protein RGF1 INDUCIBLE TRANSCRIPTION FACTOR 1-like n=1 Tax=Amaranthus tricolor TaxID=29722 RepID=UPI002585268D|nr:protein RGF1 INDUCIBLE TRANSCRIPTION FACTOR 1-like [Amaranthus tricolor]